MQIFVTDKNPQICAQNLDDKRVIKMILESAQLLSNAYYYHNWDNPPLKKAMFNHPCSIFAQKYFNFIWLQEHFYRLLREYNKRFDKNHSYEYLIKEFLIKTFDSISGIPFSNPNFVNCTPHKDIKDIHLAYKITLCEKWSKDKRKPKWTNSNEPKWRKEICLQYNIPYV